MTGLGSCLDSVSTAVFIVLRTDEWLKDKELHFDVIA